MVDKSNWLKHSVLCSDMRNPFISGSLSPFLRSVTSRCACQLQSCQGTVPPGMKFAAPGGSPCLRSFVSLLPSGADSVRHLPSPRCALLRLVRGVHQGPLVGPSSSLHLGPGQRQILRLSSAALLRCCLSLSPLLAA